MKSCYLWCVSRKVCDYLEQALYFGERFCAKSFLLVTWTAFLLRITENNDLVKHLVNLPVFRKMIRRKSLLPEIGLLSGLLESNRFQSRLEEARVAPSCTELRVYYPMNQKSSIFKKFVTLNLNHYRELWAGISKQVIYLLFAIFWKLER